MLNAKSVICLSLQRMQRHTRTSAKFVKIRNNSDVGLMKYFFTEGYGALESPAW